MLKPIDTHFMGYKFRSRLEARWAVFFSEMCWGYDYEPEGFVLEDGTPYLPDFYIKELKTWVEVKPDQITEEDKNKCMLFSKSLGEKFCVMLANGLPSPVQYMCFVNGEEACDITLSSYIRMKGWGGPYFGGDWEKQDLKAMEKAKKSRFEFGEKG